MRSVMLPRSGSTGLTLWFRSFPNASRISQRRPEYPCNRVLVRTSMAARVLHTESALPVSCNTPASRNLIEDTTTKNSSGANQPCLRILHIYKYIYIWFACCIGGFLIFCVKSCICLWMWYRITNYKTLGFQKIGD